MTSRRDGELLSRPCADLGLRRVVEALGWIGEVLPDVSLLGMRASVVVLLDRDAHAQRRQAGTDHAVTDADTLAMWEWPEAGEAFPPSAVSIVGAVARHGRDAHDLMRSARKWRGFAASGIMLPAGEVLPEDLRLECTYSGIAVARVSADQVEVEVDASPGRVSTARRTTIDRWLEEHLYGMLLARTDLTDALL